MKSIKKDRPHLHLTNNVDAGIEGVRVTTLTTSKGHVHEQGQNEKSLGASHGRILLQKGICPIGQ